jgi:signal transduction histidine kinase
VNARIRIVIAVALLAFPPAPSRCQSRKNILVLHMEDPRLPANVAAGKAIQETIGQDVTNEIFEEYIEETRLDIDFKTLRDTFRQKYAGKKIDLIMTVGPRPLSFMLKHGEELFPSVPIVFSIVDLRYYPAKLPPNVTGVSGSFEFSSTLDLILKLQPDTHQIFYIEGATSNEELLRGQAELEFKPYQGRLSFTYLNGLSLPRLLDRVGQLPPHSVLLFSSFFRDADGQAYITANVCPSIAASSSAPMYTIFETQIGCGVVGGSVFQVEASARQAAILAQRVLRGESVSHLPIEPGPRSRMVVDWRQLKRWNISDANLPPGTVIEYREPSAWDAYKKYILAGLAALLVQSILILLLTIEIRRRKRSDRAVRDLTRRVINANEEERRHVARELHDDIGQRLSLISVQFGIYANQTATNPSLAAAEFDELLKELNTLISDVHNLSHRLHSSRLEHLGLKAAIEELCQQISQRHGLQIELRAEGTLSEVPGDVSLCFYRVAQEAFNNVVHHSGATRAQLTLGEERGVLHMDVQDFGIGFKAGEVPKGLGLAAMQERVGSIGGKFAVESEPGQGTVIMVDVNLPQKHSVNGDSRMLRGADSASQNAGQRLA